MPVARADWGIRDLAHLQIFLFETGASLQMPQDLSVLDAPHAAVLKARFVSLREALDRVEHAHSQPYCPGLVHVATGIQRFGVDGVTLRPMWRWS